MLGIVFILKISGKKTVLSISGARKTGYTHAKKNEVGPLLNNIHKN